MAKLGIHHGHPLDLPSEHKDHGWSYYRFNGFFGQYQLPGGEDILHEIRQRTGNPSIVVLLERNLPDGVKVQQYIREGRVDVLRAYATVALHWLKERALEDVVLIDIWNGPERPFRTSYRGMTALSGKANLEALHQEIESRALDLGFLLVARPTRHLYIHRVNNSPRDFWLDSMTEPDVVENDKVPYWCTECGVHVSLGSQRAATLDFLLRTALWDAERIYVHAPYQKNDGAGYGGLWYVDSTRRVLQGYMVS